MEGRLREPWPCREMTPREIFHAQLEGRAFERSFNMEFGWWPENFREWDLFRDNGIQNWGHANWWFGLDSIDALSGDNWMCPFFKEEVVEETPEKKILRNADGLLMEVPKDSHSTIPRFLSSSIQSAEDWYRLKEERFRLDDPRRQVDIDYMKFLHKPDKGREYPLGVWTGSMLGKIRDTLSFEGFCYSMYDEPEMFEDMIETSCRLVEHSLDQLLPNFAFDYACGWEDICYKNGPMISVELFREWAVPRYKRIHKKLEAYGVKNWYVDCDGNTAALIPYMLEAGINTLFPYEVNACGHPGKLLAEYGGALRIIGGIDKTRLIEGKEAIKAYMESIEPLVAKGGFIPHVDHLCPPDVSPENYLYYLDLKQRMFG